MDLLELIMAEPTFKPSDKRRSYTTTRDTLPDLKKFSNTQKRLINAKRRASL